MAPLPRSSIDGQALTIAEEIERTYVREAANIAHRRAAWNIVEQPQGGNLAAEWRQRRTGEANDSSFHETQERAFREALQTHIRNFATSSSDAQAVINSRIQAQRTVLRQAGGMYPTDGITEEDIAPVRNAYIDELRPLVRGRLANSVAHRVERDRAEALAAFERANPAACRTYRVSCEEAIMVAPELDRELPAERLPQPRTQAEQIEQERARGHVRPSVHCDRMMNAADMRLGQALSDYCRQQGMTAEQTNLFAGQVREGLQGPMRLRERTPTMPPLLPPLPDPREPAMPVIAEPPIEVPRLPLAVAAREEGRNTPAA